MTNTSSLQKAIDMEDVYAITNNLLFKHEWHFGGELTAKAYKQNDDGTLTPLDEAIVQLIANYLEKQS